MEVERVAAFAVTLEPILVGEVGAQPRHGLADGFLLGGERKLQHGMAP